MKRRKWVVAATAPVAAGAVAVGVLATSLQIQGESGQKMQTGTDITIDDVVGCQDDPISVDEVRDDSFSGNGGFDTSTTAYQIGNLSGSCAGKKITLAVKLDSASVDPSVCQAAPQLTNGDFESGSTGWTGGPSGIDVWTNGQSGISAFSGDKFVRLADDDSESVYQDIATTPGEVLTWSFHYQGVPGSNYPYGQVRIGSPGSESYAGSFYGYTGYWQSASGTYTVPAGQTTTRLAIRDENDTGSYANNGAWVPVLRAGNFIDDVSFTSKACTDPGYQQVVEEPTVTVSANDTSESLDPAGAVPLSSESIQGYSVKIWE